MKLVLLSESKTKAGEAELVTTFFDNGLDLFHLRKPELTMNEMNDYLQEIPKKYWPQIVLHSHYPLAIKYNLAGIHIGRRTKKKSSLRTRLLMMFYKFRNRHLSVSTSFSNLSNLFEDNRPYDYVFLSPIFDSISKSGYQSGFVHHNLKIALNKTTHKVYALGGVSKENIKSIFDMGFQGMVLSGIIWQSDDKVEIFKEIVKEKEALEKV